MQKFLVSLATLFSLGKNKKAPGTWGTAATVPFAFFLLWCGPLVHMTATLLLLPVGVLAAEFYERQSDRHDSQEVIIDEVLGFLITMTWLPMTWQSFVFGFLLFRLLDIMKPFPIGYLDKRIQGGLGVVIDDVAAGLIANIVLQIVYKETSWLGIQAMVTS